MKRILLATALLGGLLGALPVMAEDVPPRSGPEFQVNLSYIGDQHAPDVARAGTAGGFVAVWVDDFGKHSARIKGRFFQSSGEPAGGEFEVASATAQVFSSSRVAAGPDGRFAVVWSQYDMGSMLLFLRCFDREGRPLGEAKLLSSPTRRIWGPPDIASGATGEYFVVWEALEELPRKEHWIFLQRFGPDGQALESPVQVNESTRAPLPAAYARPRIAVNGKGDALVSWNGGGSILTRRREGSSSSWAPQARLLPLDGSSYYGTAVPLLYPEGDGALVFLRNAGGEPGVAAVRLDASGSPVGGVLVIGGQIFFDLPNAALDPAGNAFVVWSQGYPRSEIRGQLFDRSWRALGSPVMTHPEPYVPYLEDFFDSEPSVAALAPGRFAVIWTNDGYDNTNVTPIGLPPGKDESGAGVFGQVFGPSRCVPGGEVLCLGEDGRFEARVTWKTPSGQTGAGHASPLTTDTGAVWFFDPGNLELMIKVLDARTVNGYFWVFYGSLSNLEYTVTIQDTVTGLEKTYHNAQRQLASRADVQAFPVIEPTAVATAEETITSEPPPSSTALSLAQDRFQVEVEFTDPRTGLAGQGRAVPLTGDTGAFWFFDPANLELMIKVLDGRSVNGKFWVFFGALSDVEYTITVTDTATGQRRTYHNDRHTLASRADVSAFPLP